MMLALRKSCSCQGPAWREPTSMHMSMGRPLRLVCQLETQCFHNPLIKEYTSNLNQNL